MLIQNLNFPTLLTLVRLILSPIVIPILITTYLPSHFFTMHFVVASVFILFSLTDFFDGYLARKNNQATTIGKMLDPIADKFLIFSTLIALVAVGKVWYLWAIILIGREFFVMALRHLALENNFALHVSWAGKLKTCLQSAWIVAVMLNFWPFEQFLLVATMTVSLLSAAHYSKIFMLKISNTIP